jgi:hypothetical protein
LQKHINKCGFADPWLTRNKKHLILTGERYCQLLVEYRQFILPSNNRDSRGRQTKRMCHHREVYSLILAALSTNGEHGEAACW